MPLLRDLPRLHAIIERRKLAQRIHSAMKASVTVMTAPAGFGKTIALNEARENAAGTHVRFDLNAGVETFFRFVSELSVTLEPLAPGLKQSFDGAFDRAMQTAEPEHSLAAWLHENLKGIRATIFIDQLQYLGEAERTARFWRPPWKRIARYSGGYS